MGTEAAAEAASTVEAISSVAMVAAALERAVAAARGKS